MQAAQLGTPAHALAPLGSRWNLVCVQQVHGRVAAVLTFLRDAGLRPGQSQ